MKSNSKKKQDVLEWIKLSDYDLEAARAMQRAGKYLYVLFCCQQAVEKRLKAVVINTTGEFPPKTHDLIRLIELAKIDLTARQQLFLRKLTAYYIETRYPEEVRELSKKVTKILASVYLKDSEEVIKCIDQLLK
ncbi:MAG: DNA-binding protein [Candidatus Omnitrophica bacterium CG23_combo_of_CG06-09_8_20_14_all_41_10]|uniref:DNA-binding protein n=1 Tax=Candidatus Sherwoodlollariibacterium unditelluris TaxID=1974757 RepID=A0A2G9YJW2_9BACT|nr:MAG: DNA-binding protein [Candidatus Omnitrophica bacterium CG23_combo_of_CG06-09_8_20_14_all_41_10]